MKSRAVAIVPWLLFGALSVILIHQLWGDLGVPSRGVTEANLVDFRYTVWSPGKDLLAGHNPYDTTAYLVRRPGNLQFPPYLPGWLTLSVPLAWLPFKVAAGVWVALELLTVVGAAVLIIRRLGWFSRGRCAAIALVAGAVLLVEPGRQGFNLGQPVFLMIIGLLLVTSTAERDRIVDWPALGLAITLLKPQVGLVVLAVLVLCQRWRTITGGLGLAALVSLPVVLLLSIDAGSPLAFLRVVRENVTIARQDNHTGDRAPVENRTDLARHLGQHLPMSVATATVVVIAIVAGLLTMAWWSAGRRGLPRVARGQVIFVFAPALCIIVLVHQTYDLVFVALVPVLWWASRGRAWDRGGRTDQLLLLASGLSLAALVHPSRLDHAVPGVSLSTAQSVGMDVALVSAACFAGICALAVARPQRRRA